MTIDSELLLASIDIEKFLSGRPMRVTKQQYGKAANVLKDADKGIDTFLLEPLKKTAVPYQIGMESYPSIINLIRQTATVDDLISRFGRMQDESVASELTMALANVLSALPSEIPENQSQTLFGIDDMEPSDYEKFKFIQRLRVLDQPMIIFTLMHHNQLTQNEVEALMAYYPELYEAFKARFVENLAESMAKGNILNRQKKHQASVFLDVMELSPAQLRQLQSSYQPVEGSSDIQTNPLEHMSEVDRLNYRKAMS